MVCLIQRIRDLFTRSDLGSSPEYSSTWFQNNPRSKSTANIPKRIVDPTTWKRMLGHALKDNITSNLAVRFIDKYALENLSKRLSVEWTSYSVRFGNPRESIAFWSLLHIIGERK